MPLGRGSHPSVPSEATACMSVICRSLSAFAMLEAVAEAEES